MRFGKVVIWLVLAAFAAACAQVSGDEANDNKAWKTDDRTKVLFDGRVSFQLPAGLEPVAIDVARHGVQANPGDVEHAFVNSDKTAKILVILTDMPVAANELEDVKRFVEGLHKNYSSWEKSEIVEINGRRWFNFEWKTPPKEEGSLADLVAPPVEGESTPVPTDDRPFHQVQYSTSASGKLLHFHFAATPEKYPEFKDVFANTFKSIKIKD